MQPVAVKLRSIAKYSGKVSIFGKDLHKGDEMKVEIFQFQGHGVKAREKLSQVLQFKIPSVEYDPKVIKDLEIKDYPEIPESMKKMCGQVLPTFKGEFIQVEFELKVS